MAQAEVTKGTGPNELPEGGAAEVNQLPQAESPQAGAQQVAAGSEAAGNAPTPAGAEGSTTPASGSATPPHPAEAFMPDSSQSQPLEAPVDFSPQSESDKFIYSPGDPQVPGAVKPGASMAQGPMQPPAALEQALPLLHQASLDPEAPPQTQALLGILAYHANASRA